MPYRKPVRLKNKHIKFSAIFFSVYFRENCATMTTTKRQYFGEKLQKHNILWHKKDRVQPLGVQHGLMWRRRWDLNPCITFICDLLPQQGSPLSHLGTSPTVLPNEVGLIMITQKSEIVKAFWQQETKNFGLFLLRRQGQRILKYFCVF